MWRCGTIAAMQGVCTFQGPRTVIVPFGGQGFMPAIENRDRSMVSIPIETDPD